MKYVTERVIPMKKHTVWLLALALLLAGCSGKDSSVPQTAPAAPAAETTSRPVEEAPAETPAPTEETRPMALGRMENGVYTNTYAGIGCALDDSWTCYSAEELQSLSEDVIAAFDGTAVADVIEDGTQIYDMQADNEEALTTTNVVFVKLGMRERIAYKLMSDEAVIQTVLDQKDMLVEGYTQAGIEVSSMEAVPATFLGEERMVLRTEAAVQGVPYYILQAFDYRLGEFGMTVTVGSYVEDHTQELLQLYYPL